MATSLPVRSAIISFLVLVMLSMGGGDAFAVTQPQGGTPADAARAAIAADVAAKRPLRLIIRDARNAGLSMKDIILALVKAGCALNDAVHEAVLDGQDIPDAISAALSLCYVNGSISPNALNAVVSSALSAGAGKQVITDTALGLGLPSDAVANAIASAGASHGQVDAPVYGYSAPSPQSMPTMYGPSTPVVIGGGGGGGSSTPASPHKPQRK